MIYYVYSDGVLLSDAHESFTVLFCTALDSEQIAYTICDIDKNEYVLMDNNIIKK